LAWAFLQQTYSSFNYFLGFFQAAEEREELVDDV